MFRNVNSHPERERKGNNMATKFLIIPAFDISANLKMPKVMLVTGEGEDEPISRKQNTK